MSYQVCAREDVDVAAQESADVPPPLVNVGVFVERDAGNVPLPQEVADELRRRILVAEDDDGSTLLHVARDGVQQVERLANLADPDELLVYVRGNLKDYVRSKALIPNPNLNSPRGG